jgi:hypothetical protein
LVETKEDKVSKERWESVAALSPMEAVKARPETVPIDLSNRKYKLTYYKYRFTMFWSNSQITGSKLDNAAMDMAKAL